MDGARPFPGYLRWLLIAALLVASYAVVRVGFAARLADQQPAAALRLAPNNAAARATQAMLAFSASPQRAKIASAESDARRAYMREPISPEALRTLGFAAESKGQLGRARALLAASEQVSKRDLLGQIWLIEDAVRRGQVAEALNHYDIALRGSKLAPDILFGPLTAATADGTLIGPMAKTLSGRPAWGNFFLLRAASTSTSPRNVAQLIQILLRNGTGVVPLAVQSLMGRLVLADDYASAWRLYAAGHPGAAPDRVRDPDFAEAPVEPTAFDWSLQQDASVAGSVTSDRAGSRLSFHAAVGTGGTVARQLLLLPPGSRNVLSFRVMGTNAKAEDKPFWQVVCARDEREIARSSLPASEAWLAIRSRPFSVPAGCVAQWLQLVLVSTDSPEGVHGAAGHVGIRRLGMTQEQNQ